MHVHAQRRHETSMSKHYDRAYFDTWYRQRGTHARARLERKVALAVAVAEFQLERPVASVLDIGCGEGAWRAPLKRLRPDAGYLGFDASTYAVRRFGAQRNLHLARFGDFEHLRPCAPADLLVASDVLHYLEARELDRGLHGIAELCHGVAFLETYTRDDAISGDLDGFKRRPAAFYRRRFEAHGFQWLGNQCWLSPALAGQTSSLEGVPELR